MATGQRCCGSTSPQHNAAIQKRSFEITERIFKAGQDAEFDLQQAKTQYLATLATIPDLEATLIQFATRSPHCSAGLPGEVPELASVTGHLPAVGAALNLEGIPAQLLLRRPDIRTAAWQIAAQSAQIGIAKADYFPAITLLGSIGWSGDSLDATPDTRSLVAGPALKWNVFDFGRIRGNVRLQDARLQESIEVFQNSVLAGSAGDRRRRDQRGENRRAASDSRRCAASPRSAHWNLRIRVTRKVTRIFSG